MNDLYRDSIANKLFAFVFSRSDELIVIGVYGSQDRYMYLSRSRVDRFWNRAQGISNYGIDLIIPEYSNFSTERFDIILTFLIPHLKTEIALKPGGRLNKKDGLTRYGDSHVKDKTS